MKWVREQEWAPPFLTLWEKGSALVCGGWGLGLHGDRELKAGRSKKRRKRKKKWVCVEALDPQGLMVQPFSTGVPKFNHRVQKII